MTSAMRGNAERRVNAGGGPAHEVAQVAQVAPAAGVSEASEASEQAGVADVVDAALRLLRSLPERPRRLRVRAAGTVIDLDWRTPLATGGTQSAPEESAGAPAAGPPAPAGALPEPAGGPTAETHHVCAPSVGTFYRAPGPGAAPFVDVDAVVGSGQQIGIIEAMKLMLPVEADRAGRVVEVLVEDGQPVEYGQRLITLAPVAASAS